MSGGAMIEDVYFQKERTFTPSGGLLLLNHHNKKKSSEEVKVLNM